MNILIIVILAMLTENYVLMKFLGICPFLGVSKRTSTALGMSMAVLFVMLVASLVTYAVQTLLLTPLGLDYLQTIAFILVIAATVQLTELAVQKLSLTLYRALGIYLPLITTNCAVLGLTIVNIQRDYTLIEVLFNAVGAALGFGIALLLFAGLREKMDTADVPDAFKGPAIAFITAGILSLAFQGFSGLVAAG